MMNPLGAVMQRVQAFIERRFTRSREEMAQEDGVDTALHHLDHTLEQVPSPPAPGEEEMARQRIQRRLREIDALYRE
jgi:hypothetical protein